MSLEAAYANGQFAAFVQLKLAFPAATHPVVQNSGVLQSQPSKDLSSQAKTNLAPPTNPYDVSQLFSVHEQGQSRTEPIRKLSADLCTSCRKERHYGPCKRPIPIKRADFNMGMSGSDPTAGNEPSTSPHYHSATSDSALARSRNARPADEQANTAFADLFRHQGIVNLSDEPGRMTGGLNKVATPRKLADFMLPGSAIHSMSEKRGPTVNVYEERTPGKAPIPGWGDEGDQRISRAFGQIDHAVDTTNIGGGFGEPSGGPAVLG